MATHRTINGSSWLGLSRLRILAMVGILLAALGPLIASSAEIAASPGRVVLITGAFRGLGLRVAQDLLIRGYKVALTGRDLADAPDWSKTPFAKFAVNVKLDLNDRESITTGFNQVVNHFGRIDAIIHNAGSVIMEPGHDLEIRNLDLITAVNFTGPAYLSNLAMDQFARQRFGRIIYFSSAASILNQPGMATYAATKAAGEKFFLTMSSDIRQDISFSGADIDISVLRLTFVKSDYDPKVTATRGEAKGSSLGFMKWLRTNSPTTDRDISVLVHRTIQAEEAPLMVNVGLDGKMVRFFSLLPQRMQTVCSALLEGGLAAFGQLNPEKK